MQFDGRGTKVMVVDSDRTTLEMVQIRLDVAGYHPIIARTGFVALDILRASRPDVLILERNMPDVDGLMLLRELKSFVPATHMFPVLLVGRAIGADDVRAGIQLGVRDVLAKPFSGAVVLERVSRLLKKSAAPAVPPPPVRKVVYV